MSTTTLGRRLGELEATARRLLPPAAEPFDPLGWLAFLSRAELERLELLIEQQVEDGDETVNIPEDFYRRALARAVMGIDTRRLDDEERQHTRLLRLPNPRRPTDPLHVLYVSVIPDLVARGVWHLETGYWRQSPDLPRTMTAAEVEAVTVSNPWPPRVAPRSELDGEPVARSIVKGNK